MSSMICIPVDPVIHLWLVGHGGVAGEGTQVSENWEGGDHCWGGKINSYWNRTGKSPELWPNYKGSNSGNISL